MDNLIHYLTMCDKIKTLLDKFQEYYGKMSFYCFDEDTSYNFINEVVTKFVNKRPNAKILFATVDYDTRQVLKDKMESKGHNVSNYTFISQKYINIYFEYNYDLFISLGIYDVKKIEALNKWCKFGLVILNEHIDDHSIINRIRTNYKDVGFIIPKRNDFTTPVEGTVHTVQLNEDDKKLFTQYNDYVTDTIKIFGDIDMIKKCRTGSENKSAAQYREELAVSNGWSNTLDTSIEFYKFVDDMYNPNALFERACNFFNIANKRRKLLQDNDAKLDKILEIVKDYRDKNMRVLIINKNDEFATKVAEYLEENGIECGEYHDNIPDKLAINEYGEPIFYKSGKNKGKQKVIKSQAISSLYEKLFNQRYINVLSIKSTSNNKLKIACDVLIFTTSIQPNVLEFKTRFKNIEYCTKPNRIDYIITDTILEQNGLYDSANLPFVKLNNIDEKIEQFDENNLDIIL